MNIENAQYQFIQGTTVNGSVRATINGQQMSIPLDPANRHYQAILEWVAKGNTIQEAD